MNSLHVSIQSQHLPLSPENQSHASKKTFSASQDILHHKHQLRETIQVTHTGGYHLTRHLNTQPKTREFEIAAVWSWAAKESQVWAPAGLATPAITTKCCCTEPRSDYPCRNSFQPLPQPGMARHIRVTPNQGVRPSQQINKQGSFRVFKHHDTTSTFISLSGGLQHLLSEDDDSSPLLDVLWSNAVCDFVGRIPADNRNKKPPSGRCQAEGESGFQPQQLRLASTS